MNTKLMIVTDRNVPFMVRLVREGDTYGRTGSLTHDKADPLVEFYDRRYIQPDWEEGQFVSRYYASTLLQGDSGLMLDTASPTWVIDADAMFAVRAWLKATTAAI